MYRVFTPPAQGMETRRQQEMSLSLLKKTGILCAKKTPAHFAPEFSRKEGSLLQIDRAGRFKSRPKLFYLGDVVIGAWFWLLLLFGLFGLLLL